MESKARTFKDPPPLVSLTCLSTCQSFCIGHWCICPLNLPTNLLLPLPIYPPVSLSPDCSAADFSICSSFSLCICLSASFPGKTFLQPLCHPLLLFPTYCHHSPGWRTGLSRCHSQHCCKPSCAARTTWPLVVQSETPPQRCWPADPARPRCPWAGTPV